MLESKPTLRPAQTEVRRRSPFWWVHHQSNGSAPPWTGDAPAYPLSVQRDSTPCSRCRTYALWAFVLRLAQQARSFLAHQLAIRRPRFFQGVILSVAATPRIRSRVCLLPRAGPLGSPGNPVAFRLFGAEACSIRHSMQVSVSSGSKQLKDVSLLLDSALAAHPSYITGSTPAGTVLPTSPSGARFAQSTHCLCISPAAAFHHPLLINGAPAIWSTVVWAQPCCMSCPH